MPKQLKKKQPEPEPQLRKRVVVQLRNGLRIIAGIFDPSIHVMRDFINFQYAGQVHPASLISVSPRIIWYREIMKDSPKTFHSEQQ